MALWDLFVGKGSTVSSKELNPIIQVSPCPEIYNTSTETPIPASTTHMPAGIPEDLSAPTKIDRSGPVRSKAGSRSRRVETRPAFFVPQEPVKKSKPAAMMPRYLMPTEPAPKAVARPPQSQAQVREGLALLRQGVVLQGRGEHQGAVEALTKAIELDPECGDAYEARGVSRDKLGDAEGARKDYEKAIGMEVNAEIERQARDNENLSTQ